MDAPLQIHKTPRCTFLPSDLWSQHAAISKDSPEGRIEGANSSKHSQHLPRSLETLAFGREFNRSLDAVSLPSSLESLTFGINFNHTLKGVNLQDLVVGL